MGRRNRAAQRVTWVRAAARWVAALAFALVAGTLVHEVIGHGLTAVMLGGRIEAVGILGLQIYPTIQWGGWTGLYGYCESRGVEGEAGKALVRLAGSLSTWLVAAGANVWLWLRRPQRRPGALMAVTCLFWIDMLTYTLPSWGMKRSVLWGPSGPHVSEPFNAAVQLGCPPNIFRTIVLVSSVAMLFSLLMRYRRDRYLKSVAS